MTFQQFLVDEQATQNFGRSLANALRQTLLCDENAGGILIFLSGELGAGKTSVVRACLRAFGVNGPIKSPTYTLLEPYEISEANQPSLKVAHLDLYRLQEPEELDYIGGRDLSEQFDLVFVEWPKKGLGALPEPEIKIQLNHKDTGRTLELHTDSLELLQKLKSIKNK